MGECTDIPVSMQQVNLFATVYLVDNNSPMNLGERIRYARERAGLSQAALAQVVGIKQQSLSALESGRTQTTSKIVELAFSLNVPVVWLAQGRGEPTTHLGDADGHGEPLWVMDVVDESDPDTPIPQSGQVVAYSDAWLAAEGIDPGWVRAWTMQGDAMEPTLQDADSVAVNTADTTIVDGRIYAIQFDDAVRLRRLRQGATGDLIIMSDNPDKARYPDEVLVRTERSALKILGRAIHRAGRIK